MELSAARSWEAAFSLSDSSRERVLCNSRLRHRYRPSSVENNGPAVPSTPLFNRKTATSQCKSPDSLNSFKTANHDKDVETGHIVAEPISQKNMPKKASSKRKTAAVTSKVSDCDQYGTLSKSICKLSNELHTASPHPLSLRSEILSNAGVNAIISSTPTQTSVSSSTRTSQKRIKTQMEVTYSDFDYEKLPARLEADFFQCDALELAPKLLGKFLRRDNVVLQITEVEAYRPNDSACHARFGVTPRTAAMFGHGGHAYVYLCYGLHVMLNVVADIKGVGAAVLIRSCAPIAGLSTIQWRRSNLSSEPILLTGPGKIGQALGLTPDWSGHPLYVAGGLELLDGPATKNILAGPRVGIKYANPEDVTALWRFAIAGTPWISAPRNNLAPRDVIAPSIQ